MWGLDQNEKSKRCHGQIQTQDGIWFCAVITEAAGKGWLGSNTSYLNETKDVSPTGTADFPIMPTYNLHL